MRKYLMIVIVLFFVLTAISNDFASIEGLYYPSDLVFRMPDNVEEAVCLEILDGRTIKVKYTGMIEKEKIVKLIGVDISQFNSSAATVLEKLIEGKKIFLSYGWQGEIEGEVSAYVWKHFPGLTGGYNLMLNAILLANGYAVVDTEEYIEVKMAAMFDETSHTAMELKIGKLKNFASDKPLQYNTLEKQLRDFLYSYYWIPKPVESPNGTTTTADENVEDTRVRTGAVCVDGTRSSATGSGACSSHGGVDYWIYADATNEDEDGGE